jgi:hypothetical protein
MTHAWPLGRPSATQAPSKTQAQIVTGLSLNHFRLIFKELAHPHPEALPDYSAILLANQLRIRTCPAAVEAGIKKGKTLHQEKSSG